jgi:inhibitor of KinA sporulation pathway (predicted exonuclease)
MLKLEPVMPHWLVIDLEATTDEGGWPLTDMEIIEIGATLVNREGRELDHFQRFVRPLRRPMLTPFCRELTRITQAQIDGAQPLSEVWPLFERWLGQHHARLEGWASWGDYDRKQLLQEWQRSQLHSALAQLPHMNLKQRFAKARRLERPLGLNGALQLAGLQFTGQQHRALEDARNTARLLPLILPG